jgi:hypothetical protein
VKAGLNAFAQLDLSSDRGLTLIKDSLHLDRAQIDVLVQIGARPVSALVSAAISGSFNDNLVFTGALRLQLSGGVPSVGLLGQVAVDVAGQPLTFTGQLDIGPNGALLAATMPAPWRGAFGVAGLTLSDLALLVGISWELLPAVGIAATMSLGNFAGSAALLFDATVPSRSLLAGSVSDLGLDDVATTFLSGVQQPDALVPVLAGCRLQGVHLFDLPATLVADLDTSSVTAAVAAAFQQLGQITLPQGPAALLTVGEPGQRWHLTDRATLRHYGIERQGQALAVSRSVQLYVAPEPTLIGKLTFPAGTRLTADLTVFGCTGSIDVDVDPNAGIAASASLTPIDSGEVFSLTGAGGVGGPHFSLATYDAPGQSVRGPHCLVSGAVTMLGFTRQVDLAIDRNGFRLTVSASLFGSVAADLTVSLPLQNFVAAQLSVQASLQNNLLSTIKTRATESIQQASSAASQSIGDAEGKVSDAQADVQRIQAEIGPEVAQIRSERARADSTLRDALNSVATIQNQIDSEQRTINGLNTAIARLKGQLTFWNAAWIGPQILDKGRQLAQHQVTLAGEKAALITAQGVLQGARSAVTSTPIEADPRVSGRFAELAVARAGLTAAQATLSATQISVGGFMGVGTWLASNGPGQLVDVRAASFSGSLGVLSGGSAALQISYVLLGQRGELAAGVDLKDAEQLVSAAAEALTNEAGALAPRG